jgi:hypothetical protein
MGSRSRKAKLQVRLSDVYLVYKYQGALKKEKKNATYIPTYLFLRFFLKRLRSDFNKIFLWCFLAPHAEKRPKTRLKKSKGKDDRKKFFSLNFFGQRLLTWTPPC